MAGLATSFEGILNQHFQDRLFWVSSAFCGGDFSGFGTGGFLII
jgi:hypothetical protein